MRCSKSCYLYDLELVDLFEDTVIEQVYYKSSRTEPLTERKKLYIINKMEIKL